MHTVLMPCPMVTAAAAAAAAAVYSFEVLPTGSEGTAAAWREGCHGQDSGRK